MSGKFDSIEWRIKRDKYMMEWLGDKHAVHFVQMVGECSEFFDDLIDKDKPVSDDWICSMLFKLMIDMHENPFFSYHKTHLLPIMSMSINCWLDANTLERGDDNDKNRAFVLRDLTIEVLLRSIELVRGREYLRSVSLPVRRFFLHETLDEYKESL